jgi:glycosyltransferase involved in cell wall biosynthesis
MEEVVWHLSNSLASLGEEVKVVTGSPFGKKPAKKVCIDVHRTLFSVSRAPIIPGAWRSVARGNFDVIMPFFSYPGLSEIATVIGSFKAPIIANYQMDLWPEESTPPHTSLLMQIARKNLTFALRYADRILCSTKSYALTSPVLRGFGNRVAVIPNGVDSNFFKPISREDKNQLRLELGINHSKIGIFCGRFVPYKGIIHLLRAIRLLKKKKIDFHLLLMGQGPLKEQIRKSIHSLRISNMVTIISHTKKLDLQNKTDLYRKHLQAADMIFLPSTSRLEAFGIALLEGMACGLAPIASDIPGVKEIVKSADGHLTEPGDPSSIANAIELLLQDENQLSRLMRKGRKATEDHYNWKIIGKQIQDQIRDLHME